MSTPVTGYHLKCIHSVLRLQLDKQYVSVVTSPDHFDPFGSTGKWQTSDRALYVVSNTVKCE